MCDDSFAVTKPIPVHIAGVTFVSQAIGLEVAPRATRRTWISRARAKPNAHSDSAKGARPGSVALEPGLPDGSAVRQTHNNDTIAP